MEEEDLFGLGTGGTPEQAQAAAGPAGTGKGGGLRGMAFDDVYDVDADLSPDEFVRMTYINLAKCSFTPEVLDCVFDPVETCMMQVVGCTAHVDTAYKYDRVEYSTASVMGKETRYNSRHQAYTVDVPQTVEVPQYIPETGSYSADVEGCVFNLRDFSAADTQGTYLFYMDCCMPDPGRTTKRKADGYKNLRLADEAYLRATRRCCDIANSNAPLPDNYDHISFSPTYYVRRVSCYMMPYYSTAYRIGEDSYKAKGFACGPAKVWQECPPDGIGRTSLAEKAEKDTHLKGVKYAFPIATWVLYLLAIILSLAAGVNCFWTFVLPFAAYLIGLIAYPIAANMCNNYAASLNGTWPARMCAKLNSVFAAHGFCPLTPAEEREFKQVDFTLEERKQHGFSDISTYAGLVFIIFAVTLFAVLIAAAAILG